MKHFDETQWKLFVEEKVNEETKTEMENHMLDCEECLQLYLAALEAVDSDDELTDDFTDKVMKKIEIEDSSLIKLQQDLKNTSRVNEAKKRNNNMLIYYVCAASITLFFTFNGVFQRVTQNTPGVLSQMYKATIEVDGKQSESLINIYSQKLSNVIEDFKTYKHKKGF